MPRIGIGIGLGRTFYAGSFADAYNTRVLADGGTIEATPCVNAASTLLQSASLLLIPSGYKSGVAYSQLPNNGNGDLTWTRASTANRFNPSGVIESVASGVPRLSYMYGSCPALLLEPQRTNSILNSEAISNWPTKVELTITDNNAISPRGSQDASLIQQTIGGNAASLISNNVSITTGQVQVVSFYAKPKEVTVMNFRLGTTTLWSGNIRPSIAINLSNGTITSQTNCTCISQSVGNGWYRYVITTAATIASGTSFFQNNATAISPNSGDGFYLWGVQWEQNANFPTTYIPTTSATATRVADSFSRNNIYTNGLITSSGGTWYVELKNNVAYVRDNTQRFGIADTSAFSNDGLTITAPSSSSSRLSIQKRIASTLTNLYTTTTDTVKIAIKWNGTTADVFENGVKVIAATAFTPTNMEFFGSTGACFPIFIQAMALFSTPLSDTDCVSLTT